MENINYDLWAVAVCQAKNEIAKILKNSGYVSFVDYTAYYIFKHHLLKNEDNIKVYLDTLIKQSIKYFNKSSWSYDRDVDWFKTAVKDKVTKYLQSYEEIVRSKQ